MKYPIDLSSLLTQLCQYSPLVIIVIKVPLNYLQPSQTYAVV